MIVIGVLALQGGFREHIEALERVAYKDNPLKVIEVRNSHDLSICDGLILPGGESTVMFRLIQSGGLAKPLQSFTGPLWGTCAGLILLSKDFLGGLDVEVERNGFGRQIRSRERLLVTPTGADGGMGTGIFIRAPMITFTGKDVQIIACIHHDNGLVPVAVIQGNRLGTAFHPELGQDIHWHEKFIRMIVKE